MNKMPWQWCELKETITEINSYTQKEEIESLTHFLLNYMDILEKQNTEGVYMNKVTKVTIETKYTTIFDIEKMYNDYLDYISSHEDSNLYNYLDYLDNKYKYEIHEKYETFIAFRDNREKFYTLLAQEHKNAKTEKGGLNECDNG